MEGSGSLLNSEELGLKDINADYTERYGFHDAEDYLYKAPKGLTRELVEKISEFKNEPQWMLEFRLKAFDHFLAREMPTWGSPLMAEVDFDNIHYFVRASEKPERSWDDVPDDIKNTFDRLGIPEAERKFLAGVGAQYESEVVYHQVNKDLEDQGVIFLDMDSALRDHEDLVREYFATIIPANDNKLASLNSAVWSGGSFVYVPPGVHVEMPLQAYFRINTENMGQFERTIIIADEGSYVHYVEGCSAPTYSSSSLHSAVVELIAKPGARIRYTTVQYWSQNVFNLVTKRAVAEKDATVEWVDANLGCLAEGSTVTTPSGPVAIEAIELGDLVMSWHEEYQKFVWSEVTAKRYSGEQQVREVSAGASKLLVTDNHPFYSYVYDADRPAKLGRYRLDYVRADELSHAIVPASTLPNGSAVKMKKVQAPDLTVFKGSNQYQAEFKSTRLSTRRRFDLPRSSSPDLMWIFGYWVGDGDIDVRAGKSEGIRRWGKVGFSCPGESRARKKLLSSMEMFSPGPYLERGDGIHICWSGLDLVDYFESNGLAGGCRTKRVPLWVSSAPTEHRSAFIAGYIDADGCLTGRSLSIKSVNKPLLEDVASLLVDMGIPSRLHTEFEEDRQVEIMGVECTAHGSHQLVLRPDARIVTHLSNDMRSRILAIRGYKCAPFRKIGRSGIKLADQLEVRKVKVGEHIGSKPTWDIEVAETGNFVSQGFIVHNSKLTSKYPSVYLMGERAHGEILSIAFAGKGQHQDAGGKVIHVAPNTTSNIFAKSISKDGGRSSYRGLLEVAKGATGSKSKVVCDALLLDEDSRSDTYPTIRIGEQNVDVGHEATVSKVGDEQLFYLMSHGLSEEEAGKLIVNGFIEPIVKELPMEYAVEMNRLIELQMEGSIG